MGPLDGQSMSSSPLYLALWILQPVLQGVIAILMFRRRLHKSFPVFFAYMPVQIAIFCLGFPIYHLFRGDRFYFYAYCILTAVDLIFNFKIIHEIFLDIFHPYAALRDLGNALFKWGALVMVLVSVVLISATPGWGDPFTRTMFVVQRSVRLVQCGLLVFLLAFCKSLEVSWKRLSFGLSVGFGLTAASDLLTNALYTGRHMSHNIENILTSASCDLSLLVWLLFTLWNQRPALTPVLVPQRWDEALLEIKPSMDSESLIPMFENMVDRALSRAHDTHV